MIAGGVGKIHEHAEWGMECGPFESEEDVVTLTSFPEEPCNGEGQEFNVGFRMPNCWNGQPRDDDDSHVMYSIGGSNEKDDPCPDGYQKIPQLWLFLEFPNGYQGGKHVFSDGQKGFGASIF